MVPVVEGEIIDVIDEPMPGMVRTTEIEATRVTLPGSDDGNGNKSAPVVRRAGLIPTASAVDAVKCCSLGAVFQTEIAPGRSPCSPFSLRRCGYG